MHVSIDRVSQGKKTALAKLCENSTSMAFTVGFSEINLCFLCLIMIKGSVFFFFHQRDLGYGNEGYPILVLRLYINH